MDIFFAILAGTAAVLFMILIVAALYEFARELREEIKRDRLEEKDHGRKDTGKRKRGNRKTI